MSPCTLSSPGVLVPVAAHSASSTAPTGLSPDWPRLAHLLGSPPSSFPRCSGARPGKTASTGLLALTYVTQPAECWREMELVRRVARYSKQGYWSGQPFPSPGDLPDPGVESGSPALQADSVLSEPPGKPFEKNQSWSNSTECTILTTFKPPVTSSPVNTSSRSAPPALAPTAQLSVTMSLPAPGASCK
ncbi:hypothetical protein MJG53_016055 [Ovis ammon polii x Ovis aries]|uniref:Uncharacterized protein n=1 Tax=Ovis ammon polii x Ovis aries TaxID=2918886 RepID=A0ACB9UAB2_9CETA|nr:hypothetical protein MJG53_016055 [Ovis ammon polii x Ovis aries]